MQTSLFDYHLPEHLIARTPAERRDRSRLMVIDRKSRKVTHTEFANLPDFLPQGARLFRNNATVLRARLKAQRPSGGQVECLLLRPAKPTDIAFFAAGEGAAKNALHTADSEAQISHWDFVCLLKPGKRLRPGETFTREGHFTATVLDKHPDGENRVRFTPLRGQQSVVEIATLAGDLPLPPYIEQARIADNERRQTTFADNERRQSALTDKGNQQDALTDIENPPASGTRHESRNHQDALIDTENRQSAFADNERYQTVYADPSRTVAAAAPTAGLHFTPELLARLAAQGIDAHDLTLHVGLDTFRPITAENVEEHQIHRELYEIPTATLAALEPLPTRPRIAVGTTTLRSIEHYFRHRTAPAHTANANAAVPNTLAATANTDVTAADGATNTNYTTTLTDNTGGQHSIAQSDPSGPISGSALSTATPPWLAEADIFIYPPAQFAGVEVLITNFHLPKSTLLCLVSAFLTPGSTDGIDWLKELYAEAIARNYRFFSYGDAMLIL